MRKCATFLTVALVPVIAGACIATGGAQPTTTARPGDAAYCQALTKLQSAGISC